VSDRRPQPGRRTAASRVAGFRGSGLRPSRLNQRHRASVVL